MAVVDSAFAGLRHTKPALRPPNKAAYGGRASCDDQCAPLMPSVRWLTLHDGNDENVKLAIFDIDGTLTDTNSVDDGCFVKALSEAHAITEINTDWATYHTLPTLELPYRFQRNLVVILRDGS